ncbi:MAG: tRNA preQ1(34) S-adenosylmethionine ribosyltransferase-isomerase QueA [Thermodesulfobacteria bacterium]|nr:tRNA preQ1(34) S-adenosylmethionine ribosyltransferase-isomerase QueA [Thermodesulfobacteriota bacterium]
MTNEDFLLSSYQYELPEELIAQEPSEKREESRLLVLNRQDDTITHARFKEIVRYLKPGDCLVINKTKVFPARLLGRKPTGGKLELLLLEFPKTDPERAGVARARALAKSSKPLKVGQHLSFSDLLEVSVTARDPGGQYELLLHYNGDLTQILEEIGRMPLPPYIKRESEKPLDRVRYQTVYAKDVGSVAAPTAGLHFNQETMEALAQKGVKIAPVTLHVGYGTFSPIRSEDIRLHRIHSEWVNMPEETASIINETKKEGGRVIAVGTTSVRTLEHVFKETGKVCAYSGQCRLYIYPGFEFSVVDGMVTNFHLPCSSLLVLVSAFVGRKRILSVYEEAIKKGYRFFSYGDAMLIL